MRDCLPIAIAAFPPLEPLQGFPRVKNSELVLRGLQFAHLQKSTRFFFWQGRLRPNRNRRSNFDARGFIHESSGTRFLPKIPGTPDLGSDGASPNQRILIAFCESLFV